MAVEVYLSYKREDLSKGLARRIKLFIEQKYHYTVIWDESGIDTGDDIRAYMDRLSKGANIIFLIGPNFLASPYCMYELAATAEQPDFSNRAFAILLPGVTLDGERIMQVIEDWANKWKEFKQDVDHLAEINPAIITAKMRQELDVLEKIARGSSAGLFALANKKWMDSTEAGELDWEELGRFLSKWVTRKNPEGRQWWLIVGLVATLMVAVSLIWIFDPFKGSQPKDIPPEVLALPMRMKDVRGGEFWMGTDTAWLHRPDERPRHKVRVGDFEIGRTEVDRALWLAVMHEPSGPQSSCMNCPITNVSWIECQVFILRLNQLTGEFYRLPSEAEWEYAAKGGIYHSGFNLAGSNVPEEVEWFEGNSGDSAHPIGQLKPNALGLYDMSGNVLEWCEDWYGVYDTTADAAIDPRGPREGQFKVARGGSFDRGWHWGRTFLREASNPKKAFQNLGFRLAKGRH